MTAQRRPTDPRPLPIHRPPPTSDIPTSGGPVHMHALVPTWATPFAFLTDMMEWREALHVETLEAVRRQILHEHGSAANPVADYVRPTTCCDRSPDCAHGV